MFVDDVSACLLDENVTIFKEWTVQSYEGNSQIFFIV